PGARQRHHIRTAIWRVEPLRVEEIACESRPRRRGKAQAGPLEEAETTERRLTEGLRLRDDRREYRLQLARRGVDDAEDFGRRGPLFEGLARLGQEPRVLHCDHCLSGEIL